jgi:hypothetical protein
VNYANPVFHVNLIFLRNFKGNFLDQMEINGKKENLIDFVKPQQSIILETFGKKNSLKGFYILNLQNKSTFKMVREKFI